MNPFEMVIGIVLIVMVANVLKARFASGGGRHGRADNSEMLRLREEVGRLRERVQVLERVITDQRESSELSLEIEKLRGN
ncbi:MAG: hypothetical protein R3E02_09715 [Blastomonas sp.]